MDAWNAGEDVANGRQVTERRCLFIADVFVPHRTRSVDRLSRTLSSLVPSLTRPQSARFAATILPAQAINNGLHRPSFANGRLDQNLLVDESPKMVRRGCCMGHQASAQSNIPTHVHAPACHLRCCAFMVSWPQYRPERH